MQDLDCTRFGSWKIRIMQDLDCGRFGSCKIWIVEDLDHARFGLFKIWIMQDLDCSRFGSLDCEKFGAKFEKCVEFGAYARFGNCSFSLFGSQCSAVEAQLSLN